MNDNWIAHSHFVPDVTFRDHPRKVFDVRLVARTFCFVILLLNLTSQLYSQNISNSDQLVVNELFAEQHVPESALHIHLHCSELSNDERYEFLLNWVLPNDTHQNIRLNFGFAPTYPIPVVSEQLALAATDATMSSDGGYLISPALDLIAAAKVNNHLESLRERVEAIPASDPATTRNRQALLLLIEIERENHQRILSELDAFLPHANPNILDGPSDAEWLILIKLLPVDALKNEIGDSIFRYAPWARDWYRPDPTRHHWLAMIAQSRQSIIDRIEQGEYRPDVHELARWSPVAKSNYRFSGDGRPATQWDEHHGYLENVSSYFDDFLFYDIPLRGDYEVECEIPPFDWRETSLLVAGKWISPYYNRKEYEIGTFDRDFGNRDLNVLLSKDRDWMRYRVTVRDLVATTYVNGHPLHSEKLNPDHAPWLAVRSGQRQDGGVRNLRITGNPTIPEEIDLLADPQLASWSPYFQDPYNEKVVNWWISEPDSGMELRAGWNPAQRITFQLPFLQPKPVHRLKVYNERLLQYARPLLEDGIITYEFYHRPGSVHVNPALGRQAFVIQSDGVYSHWVTDGKYDRTGIDPANMTLHAENQLLSAPLPLNQNDWNKIQFEFRDGSLTLTLNGETVYRQKIEENHSERFGFFYFSDQDSVRVRNVIYRGDWPRQLPSLAEQEMAFDETDFLENDREHLTEQWEYDFTKRDDWLQKFSIIRGDAQFHFEATDRGLIAARESVEGYRGATINPKLQIEGDFDITLEYDAFETETSPGGYNAAYMLVRFDTPEQDEHFISRRQVNNGTELKQELHCAIVRRLPDGEFRSHFAIPPCEERAGRLRLIRRGDILYYLTAEHDSAFFQLRGKTKIFAGDARVNDISLISQTFKKGRTSVIWKKLSIKAEKLDGVSLLSAAEQITQLNEQRDRLPARFTHDFTQASPDENFELRENVSPWNKNDHGWKISAVGLDTWSGPGFHFRRSVSGDFDISLAFEVLEFPILSKGDRSAVYLQTQTLDRDQTYLNAIFRRTPEDLFESTGQIRTKRPDGGYDYPSFGKANIPNVNQLRICRRGERVYFIVKSEESASEILVGERDFPSFVLPQDYTRVMVNTSGEKLKTVVLLKSFEVHAEAISPGVAP